MLRLVPYPRFPGKVQTAKVGGTNPDPCQCGSSPVSPTKAPWWAGQLGTNTWRGGDGLVRSELKEISPDGVDVSSFDEAKRVASVAEEERRIIEAERRRLNFDA